MRLVAGRSLRTLGAAGFVAGACLALSVASGLTIGRYRQVSAVIAITSTAARFTPTPTVTLTPTPVITPTASATRPPTATIMPTESVQDILDWASDYISSGSDPQVLVDRLSPVLDYVSDPADTAQLHGYLGAAEYQLGHYLLAAGHFEHVHDFDSTPDTLAVVAQAYDLGGDLPHALGAYLILADWPGPEGDSYREYARERADAIIALIGTPTPST